MNPQYLEAHQSRSRDPAAYEYELAMAIEEVFGEGVHGLEGLVNGLAARGVTLRDGRPISTDGFLSEIRGLEQGT